MFGDCCMVQLLYVQPYGYGSSGVDSVVMAVFVVVMVVSTRRGMLVVAMVLVVVCNTDLHISSDVCRMIANNEKTNHNNKKPRYRDGLLPSYRD